MIATQSGSRNTGRSRENNINMTGTKCIDVTDLTRQETFGGEKGNRRFTVRFYYPGKDDPERQPAELLTESKRKLCGRKADFTLYNRRVRTYEDLDIQDGRFPLILFSHSYGGYAEQNSDLCSFLAGRGYIVASVAHTYEAEETIFTDGTVIPADPSLIENNEPLIPTLRLALRKLSPEEALVRFSAYQEKYGRYSADHLESWLQDDRCAMRTIREMTETEGSFLYHKIDYSHGIGVTGHSYGGNAAYAHCLEDDEISCGVNMDGGLFGHFGEKVNHKPFMQIVNKLNTNFVTRCFFYHDKAVHFLKFRHMMHQGFTDLKLIMKLPIVVGKEDPVLALDTLNEAHAAFFDRYLRQANTGNNTPLPIRTEALETYEVL